MYICIIKQERRGVFPEQYKFSIMAKYILVKKVKGKKYGYQVIDAKLREKNKPGYNPERVAVNNARRECWTDCPEPERYPLSHDGADFDQWGDCGFGIHD